jgi:hypothetical protein
MSHPPSKREREERKRKGGREVCFFFGLEDFGRIPHTTTNEHRHTHPQMQMEHQSPSKFKDLPSENVLFGPLEMIPTSLDDLQQNSKEKPERNNQVITEENQMNEELERQGWFSWISSKVSSSMESLKSVFVPRELFDSICFFLIFFSSSVSSANRPRFFLFLHRISVLTEATKIMATIFGDLDASRLEIITCMMVIQGLLAFFFLRFLFFQWV